MQTAAPQPGGVLLPRLALVLSLAAGLLVAAGILYHNPPGTSWVTPPCMLHKATGLHCPGCGSTRATYALLHGDVMGAMKKNLLFMAALPFLAWWSLRSAVAWVQGRPGPASTFDFKLWMCWTLVATILAFAVMRNLPWKPFSLLAPH